MPVFVDTNVIIYTLGRDSAKAEIAEGILVKQPTLSVQVINEVLNVCRVKLGFDLGLRHRLAEELLAGCRVVALDVPTARKAMHLEARYGFAYWDALIVASALQSSCDTLYTEDMQHGQIIDGLTIHNPFLGQ